jgi:hypothetical protein
MADGGSVVSADSNGYLIHLGQAMQAMAQAQPLNANSASTTSSLGSSALSSTVFGGIGVQFGLANNQLQTGVSDGLVKTNQLLFSTTNNVNTVIQRYMEADDNVAKTYQRLMEELRPDLTVKSPPVPLPRPRPVGLTLSDKAVKSIMKWEGAKGEQGGRDEVYGFRQGNNNGYDEIMAARNQYGKGSPEEQAVVKQLLEKHAAQAGALNFSDPGEQAAIASTAHMRGTGGARAILNSMVTGNIQGSARQIDPNALSTLQQMSPSDFQQQLRDARINYDQAIYGNTMTTQGGVTQNWWDRYGNGLTARYNTEQQDFQSLSPGN